MKHRHQKIAIVHDWLVNYAGSERCVESFTNIWPDADVFTLVDFLDNEQRRIILKGKTAQTSFLQSMPFAKKHHRNYLPLFPTAIERFDLSDYDIIISSSHSVAKGVPTKYDQLHICYCHSPMRYAWDQGDHYLHGVKGKIARLFINYLKKWDKKSSENVSCFIANSNHIAEKIKRIYNREAGVIYPPVDTDKYEPENKKENYYLAASRMVPYKRLDLIIKAFNSLKEKKLIVIGSGPESEKLKKIAGININILTHQPPEILKEYMQQAKAFVFAAEEDFGIIIVEVMACGTPVIAFDSGGVKETVLDGETGILFKEQTVNSIIHAVTNFELGKNSFDPIKIHKHSEQFSRKTFERKINAFVDEKADEFFR